MTNNPLVSVIIPNFNGQKFLPVCLSSLFRSSYTNFEIIVIDDCSTDGSLEVLKKFAKIKLLQNSHNQGASASRNNALTQARGEIVAFLDNDTRVEKKWLEELIRPLISSKSDIGATCSKTLIYQHPKIISTAGLLLVPHTGWGIARGGMAKDGIAKWDQEAETVSISAALAVKKSVIDQIGEFDEKLAVHTEDLDFCWRIWLAGYKILYIPTSRVYHWSKNQEERAKLMAATKSFVYFHINKNTFRTLLKNYSWTWLLKYLPAAIFIVFGRGLFVLVSRLDASALLAAFKALIWNIANLPDTISNRHQIQKIRRVSDSYLYSKIMSHESLWRIYKNYYV